MTYPPLDITAHWSRLNDGLVQLVEYVPDEKLNWSPKPDLWNFKGIFIHICVARHNWMSRDIKDGKQSPNVIVEAQTKEGIRKHLGLSWQRLEGLLSNETRLAATFESDHEDGSHQVYCGHWIAFHGLEHDIHHRADIFHYLALLGIEHPDVGTP
jgi:uncharacterized damage-inducible protein DinB